MIDAGAINENRSSGKTYELRTINDIFDKVPLGRIPVLLDEMKFLALHRAKFNEETGRLGLKGQHDEVLKWVDDGNMSVETSIAIHPEGTA